MFAERGGTFGIIELDCKANRLSVKSSRLDLTVTFPLIPVRRGIAKSIDYYVGTTGATISVTAKGAHFVKYTEPAPITVDHETKTGQERSRARKLTPKVKAKIGSAELEANPGSLDSSWKTISESTVKYEYKEFLIVPIRSDGLLAWQIDMPRGEKTVRDFLLGNLSLSTTLEWGTT